MSIEKPQTNPSGSEKDQAQPFTLSTALSDRIRLPHPNELEPGETVAVAISGGVDSMVTARLLKEHGHQVVALHMILLPDDQPEPGEHIRQLAARLDVPLHTVDLRHPFHESVIKPFLKGYRQGKTPNPCVICNPTIKFKALRERSLCPTAFFRQ
jgi:tRNA(Ile)-lysidine synthase TilS/MesJ